MRCVLAAGLAALVMVCGPARADGMPDEVCGVELDSRLSVYMVTVAGKPYRNKRYLTFGDAIKLRDVLRTDGACNKLAAPRPCELQLQAAGHYVIIRDGVNFDPYSTLRTLKQARSAARRLERSRLCTKFH